MRDQLHFDNTAMVIAVFAFIVSVAVFLAMFIHAWRMSKDRVKHLEEMPLDKENNQEKKDE